MYTYSVISDRKLSRCLNSEGEQVGSDRYIDLSNIENFEEIWELLDLGTILTINGEEPERVGDRFKFSIFDTVSNENYSANIAKMGNGKIRLRVGVYADAIKMRPGQIVTLGREDNGSDCILSIKTEWIHSYLFEKNTESDKYILRSQSCTNLNDENDFFEFIGKFGILQTGDTVTEGRDGAEYQTYSIEGCDSLYVGLPFDAHLALDCFEKETIKGRV